MASPSLRDLESRVGEEVGVSPWIDVTQERIDTFAKAIDEETRIFTERLQSPEAKEAMSAFLEKRKPDFSRF